MRPANQACRRCLSPDCAGDCAERPRVQRLASSEVWTLQLSAIECKQRGWAWRSVDHVERYPTPEGGWRTRKRDLFGFVDMVAVAATGRDVFAIQFTSAGNVPARAAKIRGAADLEFVRSLGWRVLVWGWHDDGRLREVEL